jgi:histone H3/H4
MSFAALDRIAKKILENLPDCEGIERGVLEKIAETSKAQLCQLLKELTEIAKHRQDPLHTNALYDQINNPRK